MTPSPRPVPFTSPGNLLEMPTLGLQMSPPLRAIAWLHDSRFNCAFLWKNPFPIQMPYRAAMLSCCQTTEWWKRRTHTSTLRAPATGPHPYIMTSVSPGCCLLEPGILVCGDTGLIQHGLPLSNEFSLFTLPILGVDLHCDSRPSVPSPSF